MMRLLAIAFAALASLATAAEASEDPFLSKLVGTWIGRGTVLQKMDAKPERVYCKITNTLSDDGNTLVQKGRCSLASNSGRVDGTIVALGGDAYGGELSSLVSRGPAALKGTLAGARLVLTVNYDDKLSGDPVEATNTLAVNGKGYTLTSTRNDVNGKPFTSSEIVFTAE
jgi:hypothetical protein